MLCSGGADLSKYLLTHALLSDHNVMQHVQACILLGQQFLLVLPYGEALCEKVCLLKGFECGRSFSKDLLSLALLHR